MPTITFDVPDGALGVAFVTERVRERDACCGGAGSGIGAASSPNRRRPKSPARAAEFIDELSHRRIPVAQVTAEELQGEIHRE